MGGLKKISLLSLQPPSHMPTAQELKRAWEALDAQIAMAEQEDREAEKARLWAKEEACLQAEEEAREKAWREEEA